MGRAAVIQADDLAAGEIPHALFFSTNAAAPGVFRFPATKTDGSNMDGVGAPIPEGARVRLDPSLDLDALELSAGERAVATALQTHGAHDGDNGGARMAFLFEYTDDPSVYSDAGLPGDYASLEAIPWDRLQVLADWSGGGGDGPPAGDRDDAATAPGSERPTGRETRTGTGTPEITGPTLSVGQDGTYPDIQPAVDAADPGDTVLISAGTSESFTVTGDGAPITIRAAPGAEVVVDGGGGTEGQGLDGRSHISIDAKYEARGGRIHDNEVWGATEQSKSGIGLAVEDYSETRRLYDVTIRDNVIRDDAGSGLDFWTESSGEMSGITVVGKAFYGNGRGAITVNGGSFSGTTVLRDNLHPDGDTAPDALPDAFDRETP